MPTLSSLPTPLRLFLFGSLLVTALCGITEVFCKLVLHLHFPYTFPIIDPGAVSMDLLSLRAHFEHVHQRDFFDVARFAYPAPMAIPYVVFFALPDHARLLYYTFCALVFLGAGAVFAKEFIHRGMAVRSAVLFLVATLLLSYPFWFQLKQGNMEIVIFALIASGVWSFFRERLWLAAACFGIAGSMKLFPFVFLGLLLARRQFRQLFFGLFCAAAVTVFSLWMLYPSIAYSWKRTNEAVGGFRADYVLHTRLDHFFDHSLWAFSKTLFLSAASLQRLSNAANIYLVCVAVFGLGLYFWRIQHVLFVNQVICLTAAALLFMPVSFDYTLIQLYTPWALLVLVALDSARSGHHVPGLNLAMLCLILLCAPLTELIVHGATLEARLKTLALIGLFATALWYPFPLHVSGRTPSGERTV